MIWLTHYTLSDQYLISPYSYSAESLIEIMLHKGNDHPTYMQGTLIVKLPDQICNFPYYQLYNSFYVSSENLVLDQLIIPQLIFFFILITCLVDIV